MVFNGSIKFSLQLINPNELPDQIRLFLAYILPEPQHSYCKCSGLVKRAAIFLRPVTRGSFKTVYENSDAEGGPILCQKVFHQLIKPSVESGVLK